MGGGGARCGCAFPLKSKRLPSLKFHKTPHLCVSFPNDSASIHTFLS